MQANSSSSGTVRTRHRLALLGAMPRSPAVAGPAGSKKKAGAGEEATEAQDGDLVAALRHSLEEAEHSLERTQHSARANAAACIAQVHRIPGTATFSGAVPGI